MVTPPTGWISPSSATAIRPPRWEEDQYRHEFFVNLSLVIVALDRKRRERRRLLILGPRLLRAEVVDMNGELPGLVLYRDTTEFLVSLPDDSAITNLNIYQPHGNGQAFRLELLGTVQP
jgi:hypothetical protein